jgi:hypothetical protein
MSDFKKNGYYVVKNAISEELCDFAYEYMYMRAENLKTYKKYNYISGLEEEFGTFGDDQAPNSFSIYGSVVTDMFLLKLKPVVEQCTGLQLSPNYSYLRIYINGNELKKHRDRPECEISTTLHLGGDIEWPIFLGDQKIDLNKGDMLIYRGCDFVHWREPYKGITYCQTFLHYSDINGPLYKGINFDQRPHLGLPAWFKNK